MARAKKENKTVSSLASFFMDIPPEITVKNDWTQEDIKVKPLGLFDHVNQVTRVQDPNYFKKISDADKRTWSNYMINRFLSMEPEFIELVNETQQYTVGTQMRGEIMYKLLIDLLPKSKVYLQYVKGKNEEKFDKELIEIVMLHFVIPKREAVEYIDMLHKLGGVQDLRSILMKYGYEEKQIAKMVK